MQSLLLGMHHADLCPAAPFALLSTQLPLLSCSNRKVSYDLYYPYAGQLA